MLTYSFDGKSNESIYEYLYECIKKDIMDGKLKPNEKLPSKRAFANNHGISVVTVENTYGQLMAEGYIYSKPKSGFFVSHIDSQIHIKPKESRPEYKIDRKERDDIYSLTSNHTVPDNFPFLIWAKIVRALLTEQNDSLMISPPAGGVIELREAISKHLYDFRGIVCSPEQIIIGAGTEYLYGLIVQLLGRDKVYGLENPSSQKIRNIYISSGAKTAALNMDIEGVITSAENLDKADIVQISPSHHFPTGIVTSVGRRYELLEWANAAEGRYIVEDDYDSEFRLRGKPIPSMFSMDSTDKVIYFNTFTKSLSSTIRISYMVLPKALLHEFYEKLGFYSCTVSNFEQYTLAKFIESNHFEKHINRMRNHYRELRDELISKLLDSPLGSRIVIREQDAGLHFLLYIDTDMSDEKLKQMAKEQGVNVSFLSEYMSADVMPKSNRYHNVAVVNYSGLEKHDMTDIVRLLNLAWM